MPATVASATSFSRKPPATASVPESAKIAWAESSKRETTATTPATP